MDVNRYIGLPYKDKGRSIEGVDCWGLVRLVYQAEFGIELPSYTECYASATEAAEIDKLITGERGAWTEVLPGQERLGDIIVLRLLGHPMHVGVIVEPGMMVHILEGVNAVCERYTGILWRRRIVCILRHEGMK